MLLFLKLSQFYGLTNQFIKKHFDAEFLVTVTDSLTNEIKSKYVNEKSLNHKYLFDFSNYPKDF